MQKLFQILLMAGLVLGGLTVSSPAWAQTASMEIRVIRASKGGNQVDPKLSDLASKLKKAFGAKGYTSFKYLGAHTLQIAPKKSKTLKLPDGDVAKITHLGRTKDGLVELKLSVPGKTNVTIRVSPGATFFQAHVHQGNSVLVLAISLKE